MASTPPTLLADALRHDPAGPLMTYYDDASGERTELSATTMANWVAKTANLMRADLDVEAGDSVCVLLPAHWQTAVVVLAVWSLGAEPVLDPPGADVIVADEPSLAAALLAGARDVLGLSLAAMNAPLSAVRAGVVDYAAHVLGAGDRFSVVEPTGQAPAMAARLRASEVGLTGSDRVLVSNAIGVADIIDWLVTPLSAGASIVLCSNTDPVRLARRAAAERVTKTLGVSVAGFPRLDV